MIISDLKNQQEQYLDHGYVRYVDHMGDDLSFTKAARASFAKDSDVWDDREQRLLRFLVKEKHFSVFRHASVTFQVKAPLMVARQHWKYAVASTHLDDQTGWNESSRRYVTMEPEFYIPADFEWRSAPENKKQGSGVSLDSVSKEEWLELNEMAVSGAIIEDELKTYGNFWTEFATADFAVGLENYEEAMRYGICAEQARMFLPAYAMYVSYQWTASVASIMHFLVERLDSHAQFEIQELAKRIASIMINLYPETVEAFFVNMC